MKLNQKLKKNWSKPEVEVLKVKSFTKQTTKGGASERGNGQGPGVKKS